jgi:hypothetical protein
MYRSKLWRRFGWVTTLSLFAAIGGVMSEAVADAEITRFTIPRNAKWIQALWNIDTPEASGSVWTVASTAIDFQCGGPQDGPFAAAAATYFVPSRGRVESVWGGNAFTGSLTQGSKLSDARLENAVFPVNSAVFNEDGTWTTGTVDVRVNLVEQKGRGRVTSGKTRMSFTNQFSSSSWAVKGQSPATVTGSGDFAVLPASEEPFQLVAPNTPIDNGDYGKATSGVGSITSIFQQVTNP